MEFQCDAIAINESNYYPWPIPVAETALTLSYPAVDAIRRKDHVECGIINSWKCSIKNVLYLGSFRMRPPRLWLWWTGEKPKLFYYLERVKACRKVMRDTAKKIDRSTKSFIKWAWLFYSLCTINISFIYFSFFLPLCATCHIGKRNSKDSIAIVVALIFFFIQVFFYVEYKEKNICAYLILWNVIYYMWYILFKFYILM